MRNILPILIGIIAFNCFLKVAEMLPIQNGFWILSVFWATVILSAVVAIIFKRFQNKFI